jgi:plastocyanin
MSGRILLVALLLGASLGAVPAHAATVEIEITNLAFSKAVAAANVGDTIVWVNKDIFAHTATAKNGDWKVTLPAGKSGSVVLKKAGTVEYYCEYHPNMTAKLNVERQKKK